MSCVRKINLKLVTDWIRQAWCVHKSLIEESKTILSIITGLKMILKRRERKCKFIAFEQEDFKKRKFDIEFWGNKNLTMKNCYNLRKCV